jgi:para-nitrobenzyl esterase
VKGFIHLCAVVLVMAVSAPAVAQEAHVVTAPAGSVRGEVSGAVHIFRGIPYARPPVGELRWRAPLQLPRWRGVREATAFGAACYQPPSRGGSIYHNTHAAMSEDCLFLNVWAPANARSAPVLVWIHGGSLATGAGSEAMYDGSRFAERGLIVVSINYRLGALGYLAHPALSAESRRNISGNYGLLDQVQALRWIRRNIRAFGGDPSNVTIAGESAGALSVMYLMAAPDARRLFHRAIAQSAYMITAPELRNASYDNFPPAEAIGVWLAERLGAGDLAGLRSMSAEAIVNGSVGTGYFPFVTIDGRVLRRQLVESFDRGEQAHVPILAGFNEGEIRSLRFLLPPAPADATVYAREIRSRYGNLSDAFLARYPADNIPESMLATTRDAMYGWTAERLAAKQRGAGAASFLYFFDHSYSAADELGLRAFHAAEIPYVFGTMTRTAPRWPAIPQTPQEQRLSDAMLSYWATFAREGVPSALGEADWLPYDQARAYMAFEDAPIMRTEPPNGYEIHEEVVCRRRAEGRTSWNWNVGVISPPLPQEAPQC